MRSALVTLLSCCAVSGSFSAADSPTSTFKLQQREAEAETLERLNELTDAEFIETPLGDALIHLADRHRLQLVLEQRALADIGIATDYPFTLIRSQQPLRQLLDDILTGEVGDLDWYLVGGVIHVTTTEKAESTLAAHVYDVSQLLPRSDKPFHSTNVGSFGCSMGSGGGEAAGSAGGISGSGASGGFFQFSSNPAQQPNSEPPLQDSAKPAPRKTSSGQLDQHQTAYPDTYVPVETDYYDFSTLIDTIERTARPETWESMGGLGSISAMVVKTKPVLVVLQDRRGHEALSDLLAQVSAIAD